jgi:hypothetical protein
MNPVTPKMKELVAGSIDSETASSGKPTNLIVLPELMIADATPKVRSFLDSRFATCQTFPC